MPIYAMQLWSLTYGVRTDAELKEERASEASPPWATSCEAPFGCPAHAANPCRQKGGCMELTELHPRLRPIVRLMMTT